MSDHLIVAPHCDDAELGASMMLPGARLCVVSADDPVRWKEQQRAAGWAGIADIAHGGFPDAEMTHDKHLVGFIECAATGAATVFSPPLLDTHQDHATVARAVVSALRRSSVGLIEYETPSAEPVWVPNLWMPMTPDDLSEQMLLLSEYASQSNRPYMSADWIGHRAAFRGQQVGVPFAQAYRIVRTVGGPPCLP